MNPEDLELEEIMSLPGTIVAMVSVNGDLYAATTSGVYRIAPRRHTVWRRLQGYLAAALGRHHGQA